MIKMRTVVRIFSYLLLLWLCLVAGFLLWFSQIWLPRQGPQECSQLLTQAANLPVQVSTAKVLSPLALRLGYVQIDTFDSEGQVEPWIVWDPIDIRLNPWSLLAGRLGFSLDAQMIEPSHSSEVAVYSYNLFSKDWLTRVRVEKASLPHLVPDYLYPKDMNLVSAEAELSLEITGKERSPESSSRGCGHPGLKDGTAPRPSGTECFAEAPPSFRGRKS